MTTTLPVKSEEVAGFRQHHTHMLADLQRKSNFEQVLSILQQIYPGLSEDEKVRTEAKVNRLKALSSQLVQLLHRRLWLAGEWLKILEVDENEWSRTHATNGEELPAKLAQVADKLVTLYTPVQQQLDEVHSG